MAAASNPLETFIWGAGGQKISPEQVARQREIAAALMQGGMDYSPVDHWLQGAARASQGLVGGLKDRWAGEAEQRGREGFQSQWDSVFGGGGSASPVAAALAGGGAGGGSVSSASIPSGDNASYIRQGLLQRGLPEHVADAFLLNMQDESGLNPGINEAAPIVPGSRGGYGLYQLTGPRRRAYEAYAQQSGIPLDSIDGQLDFLISELSGPEANAYQAIMAAPDTGSAAAAIVNQFLRPSETHRARREASYLGGASMPPGNQVAQAGGGNPSVAQLLSLAGNEWANPGQSSVVNALLGQAMQQQDPRYQQQMALGDLNMQKAQLELDALLNPSAPKPIEVGGVLLDPMTFDPIFDSRSDTGFTLSPGQQRFDASGAPIAEVGAAPGDSWRNLSPEEATAYGIQPGTPAQINAATGEVKGLGGVNVTTNVGGENSYDQTVGKGFGDRYLTIQDDAAAARSAMNSLDVMEQAMSQPGFYSGFGADQLAQVKRLGQSIGLNAEGIDSIEAFNAQAKSAALDAMGGSLGTGFSNADRDFVLDQVPTITNTPQGNAALIRIQRALNQRKIDVARLSREYTSQNKGRLDAGFDDYLADWAEQNPVFPQGSVFGDQSQPNTTSSGVTWSFVD